MPNGPKDSENWIQTVSEIRVETKGRGFYEITSQMESLVRKSGISTGLATLLVRHTSASLLIQENADPEVRRDLERFFARIAPDGDSLYRHTSEGEDDMPAHIRAALTCVNLGIPIVEGRLALGAWQGIYLWEHRKVSHTRSVIAHILGA
jgi:secondary thiamine-phosphate synthase enzyme